MGRPNKKLMAAVEAYFADLRRVRASGGATGERSSYGPLASLLDAVGATLRPKVFCIQEPADQGAGHPDFGLYAGRQVAIGVTCMGRKEVLGLWIEQTEGAKFWLSVMNELKGRGVAEVLIAVVDGLRGFPDAIEAVFPQATVQTCIVHLIRRSLAYAS